MSELYPPEFEHDGGASAPQTQTLTFILRRESGYQVDPKVCIVEGLPHERERLVLHFPKDFTPQEVFKMLDVIKQSVNNSCNQSWNNNL